jgi:predicted cupin superfamily sugar epimerase
MSVVQNSLLGSQGLPSSSGAGPAVQKGPTNWNVVPVDQRIGAAPPASKFQQTLNALLAGTIDPAKFDFSKFTIAERQAGIAWLTAAEKKATGGDLAAMRGLRGRLE